MMTANPRVCVQFERNVKLVTDDEDACAWTFSFESVIGFGTVTELIGDEDEDPRPQPDHAALLGARLVVRGTALKSTRVWRVDLDILTGKRSEHKA